MCEDVDYFKIWGSLSPEAEKRLRDLEREMWGNLRKSVDEFIGDERPSSFNHVASFIQKKGFEKWISWHLYKGERNKSKGPLLYRRTWNFLKEIVNLKHWEDDGLCLEKFRPKEFEIEYLKIKPKYYYDFFNSMKNLKINIDSKFTDTNMSHSNYIFEICLHDMNNCYLRCMWNDLNPGFLPDLHYLSRRFLSEWDPKSFPESKKRRQSFEAIKSDMEQALAPEPKSRSNRLGLFNFLKRR